MSPFPVETSPPAIERIVRPFQAFARAEASGGLVLIACTIVALICANTRWSDGYVSFWQTTLTVGPDVLQISKPLLLWINDGLMAIFFFTVGLEIKRELLVGELASVRKAALPIAAAIGGMVVPALVYYAFNAGTPEARGWGIPMATDIAFALGIIALLGNRVPLSLRVFIAAAAIVDDLGAVLVIALFYTSEISWNAVLAGGGFLVLLVVANAAGVRRTLVYVILGVALWVAVLKSGVHAIETACRDAEAPLLRLEHALVKWVAFLIVPVFALANAAVDLRAGLGAASTSRMGLGIILGLVAGKAVGISLFAWLAVRLRLATLPAGVGWGHIAGASFIAGIGFTMSIFIAGLAFGDEVTLNTAKTAILEASLVAGILGWIVLRLVSPRNASQN